MRNLNNKTSIFTSTDFGDYDVTMRAIKNSHIPKSAADTLNVVADAVTKQQERNARAEFTIRTPFTLRSMESPRAKPHRALNKATGREIRRMFSRAGSTSPYIWTQEEDTTVRGIRGPVPIALDAARTGRNHSKSIRKANRLTRSQRLDGPIGTDGKTFAGIPKGGGRRRGIYRRSGNNHRLTMLRNLENNSVRIKGTHFHGRAVDRFGNRRFIRAVYRRECNKNLRRIH